MKLYQEIAMMAMRQEEYREYEFLNTLLPSGSGLNYGVAVNESQTTRDEIVITSEYQTMCSESGMYVGSFTFEIVVTPSLPYQIEIEFRLIDNNSGLINYDEDYEPSGEYTDDDVEEMFADYLIDTFMFALLTE